MRSMRQFLAIVRTTFLEAVQQPAALLLTISGVVATSLVPVLQFHDFGEPGRLERDGGMAYQLVLGLVLAASAASAALHAEISRGTAAAALSKPVPRPLFVVAKFVGVLALVALFWFCLLCSTLLAERAASRFMLLDGYGRHVSDRLASLLALLATPVALAAAGLLHNRRRARFGVAAFTALVLLLAGSVLALGFWERDGSWAPYHLRMDLRMIPASLLVLAALAVFAAIATGLATRLKPGPTLVTCVAVLILGLGADALAAAPAPWPLLAALVPNLQHFWLSDALGRGGRIPVAYLPPALAYAAAWCSVALALGGLAFRDRDLD